LSLFQSVVLGFIQGVTEFLPISSTAHLALFPWFLSWSDPGLAFNVALHLGTLVAVVYYFWKDLFLIAKEFVIGVSLGSFKDYSNGKLGFFIIISTIPGALFGFFLEEYAAGILRHPLAIALSLFVFGIVLYISDRFSRKRRDMLDMNIFDCLVIGLAQAFAVIPGVSRSGVTIAGGLVRNLKRDEAARFSFLLGTPLIAGALVLELRHIDYATVSSLPFVSGILTSSVFGFLSIKYMLRYVQTRSYTAFVLYRIVLALVILGTWLYKNGV
jgi:undecaprenyl-diphosphatase